MRRVRVVRRRLPDALPRPGTRPGPAAVAPTAARLRVVRRLRPGVPHGRDRAPRSGDPPVKLFPLLTIPFLIVTAGCRRAESRVVAYCAQDADFAEPAFADFQKSSGVSVEPKYDTEANKSVGLAAALAAEAGRPRADVHWNNEILGTVRLARRGVYAPYKSPSAAGYPPGTAGAGDLYQAFAARARVLIVNTDLVPAAERPGSLSDLTGPAWAGKVVMAKPQFGTTATHAACLFDVLGPDAARALFRGLKGNGVRVVAGNKQAATEVSAGRAAVGLTDTDDALIELNAGKPVALIAPDAAGHPRHPRLGVLFIPNTVALVNGGPNPAAGKALIDALLRPETEAALARAGGFQLPLHPAAADSTPPGLTMLRGAKRMAVDWDAAADKWDETQAFLRDEFAR